jgi:hypothetical protein
MKKAINKETALFMSQRREAAGKAPDNMEWLLTYFVARPTLTDPDYEFEVHERFESFGALKERARELDEPTIYVTLIYKDDDDYLI